MSGSPTQVAYQCDNRHCKQIKTPDGRSAWRAETLEKLRADGCVICGSKRLLIRGAMGLVRLDLRSPKSVRKKRRKGFQCIS